MSWNNGYRGSPSEFHAGLVLFYSFCCLQLKQDSNSEIIHYIRQKINLALMLPIMKKKKVCFLIQREFGAGKKCLDLLLFLCHIILLSEVD